MNAPYYADEAVTMHLGDSLDVLATLRDHSVDAVVTDPPYGLEFMGKDWDGADGFRRSLNPADAGRESVFGRTSRVAPEYRTDSKSSAGMAGTGYTDGGKRLARPDYTGGLNPRCLICNRWQRGSNPCRCDAPKWTQERLVRLHTFQEWCEAWARECLRVLKPGGHILAFGGSRTYHRLACAIEDAGFEVRDSCLDINGHPVHDCHNPDCDPLLGVPGAAWLYGSGFPKSLNLDGDWAGWGTALKPAFEPIVVGRKPLAGTVAANVEAHGVGALNIDACRVSWGSEGDRSAERKAKGYSEAARKALGGVVASESATGFTGEVVGSDASGGRWPTNVVLDGTQAAGLDAQSGVLTSGLMRAGITPKGARKTYGQDAASGYTREADTYGDSGGASRFFPTFRYEAKAPQDERPSVNGVSHPTVKPLDLMRWLVRLVVPVGAVVLDPFLGSGTTAEACVIEGMRCIGIERHEPYARLAVARLSKPIQPDIFGAAS